MDFNAILKMVEAYVDPVVVFLVLIVMEGIKRALPTPAGASSSTEVSPAVNRFVLPFLPLALGVLFLYLKSHWGCSFYILMSTVVTKGFVSGGLAAYIYRTYKVSIEGK